jgi:hypothetical protein
MKFTCDPQIAKGKVLHIVFPTLLLALVLLAAIAPASAQSSAYADNFGNSASIEGSWIFNIDVLLAQQTIATFNSLISFGWRRNSCDNPFSTSYGHLLRRMEV